MMESIGTLNEKSIHRLLKDCIEPDKLCQEVRLCGYVCDILNSNGIIEIQSKDFSKLRCKLFSYITETDYDITIIYPLNTIKYINWIDKNTGKLIERRKSSTVDRDIKVFEELYKIQDFLTESRVRIICCRLKTEEYKYLDGYGINNKNGATKIDKVPIEITSKLTLDCKTYEGYKQFVNIQGLSKEFTSKDFRAIHKCKIKTARIALLVLYNLGIVKRVGKQGNAILYSANTE